MELSLAPLNAAQEILRVGKQATGAHFAAALASAESITIANGVSATPLVLLFDDMAMLQKHSAGPLLLRGNSIEQFLDATYVERRVQ